MQRLITITILSIAAGAIGCGGSYLGQAETVHKSENGGTLALKGYSEKKARAQAEEQMLAHCGGAFKIVEERRVKIGTTVTAEDEYNANPVGTNADSTYTVNETKEDKFETQLTYECVAGSDTAADPAATPEPTPVAEPAPAVKAEQAPAEETNSQQL